jgi:protein-tyrosine-phosphatase
MSDAHPSILFLCVHNAGRSQMAAAFAREFGGKRITVRSGGSEPAESVNPAAVAAMREAGIDIENQQPRGFAERELHEADVVVTMGCGEECPFVPGKRYLDWEVGDPAGEPVEVVRSIRDDIAARVRALLAELGVEAS